MSLTLVHSDKFLQDLEEQFIWYIHETGLDRAEGIELAQKFKIHVFESLKFLLQNPGAGRLRFPQFTDLHGTRSWRVRPPFSRFLIYYHVGDDKLWIDRLLDGHRWIATDRD